MNDATARKVGPNSGSWEEVLNRKDVVGGNLQMKMPDGMTWRGPIVSMEPRTVHDTDVIHFEIPWRGDLKPGESVWNKMPTMSSAFVVSRDTILEDIGSGRFTFKMPGIGIATVFPRGGGRLDPKTVHGLTAEDIAATPV